jgi:hypothetical protein
MKKHQINHDNPARRWTDLYDLSVLWVAGNENFALFHLFRMKLLDFV